MFVEYTVHPKLGFKQVTGAKNSETLRKLIDPFFIRRTKEQVLPELPAKYYTEVIVDLPARQRRIYEEMRKQALAWVGEHEDQPVPAAQVTTMLIRLRQFAAAYAENVNGKVTLSEPSVKLDALMDIIEGNGPVVIFSNFRGMTDLAFLRLSDAGRRVSYVHGDTPTSKRKEAIDNFQEGRSEVFLATIQTGGTGIDLFRSSTAVFLDRSWSPADNLQAEDRLHRHGQKNAVQIISINARDTVDQAVEEKLTWKWALIKRILGG